MTSHGAAADGHPPGRPHRAWDRVDDRLTRLGLVSELRRDIALAVVVALVSVGLVAVVLTDPVRTELGSTGPLAGPAPSGRQLAAALAAAAVQSLLLGVRRLRPVSCLLAVAVLQVVLAAALPVDGSVRGLPLLVAAYTCGAHREGRQVVAAVLGAAALEGLGTVVVRTVGTGTASVGGLVGEVLAGLASYAAAAAVGGYVATRRRYVDLVRVRAAEAVAAEAARADAAVELERSRMARELHDVAAHHLSGMVVQAAVVERLIDRDPAAAKEAASWVRRQGRATLADLRLAVATLREPAGVEGGSPVPGLAALDALVDAARALGTTIEVTRLGPARDLPPLADVTVHRVAQEALANARDHAPGAAVGLRLRFTAAEVTLTVENGAATTPTDPVGGGRGFGLVGMAERAQMIGADLVAGPGADGGWRVVLTVPDRGPDGGPDESTGEGADRGRAAGAAP